MQEHDARILRGAAIPAAIAGSLAVITAAFTVGSLGAASAAAGVALVLVFFVGGLLVVAYVARQNRDYAMPAMLGTYLVKMILLGVALATVNGAEIVHPRAFAWSAALCVVVWLVGHTRAVATARMLHVDPEEQR